MVQLPIAAAAVLSSGLLTGCADDPEREPHPSDHTATDDTGTEVTDDSDTTDSDTTDSGPTESTPPDTGPDDFDGDGYTEPEDCDDADASMHPGAEDDCDDEVDEDCDGAPRSCYEPLPDIMLDAADTRIFPSHPLGRWDSIGNVAVSLGDLDADGIGDFGTLWSGTHALDERAHKEAWVFNGPIDAGGLLANDEAVAIVRQRSWHQEELTAMASAGDVDGDGYDDVVFGTWEDHGGVHVFLGPIVGDVTVNDSATASWTSWPAGNEGAGWSVDGAFDFDGDGHDDFVVGAPWVLDHGAAYWISGADLEFKHFSDADAILDGLSTDSARGWAVTGLGDVDGDGLDDFATGAYAGTVFVYTGGALSGELDSLDAAHVGIDRESDDDEHGNQLADGGDFNDDGYADLLIAATDSNAGTVHIIAGPMDASGDASALALATFDGESPGDEFGDGMDGSMDVNVDGNTDLLLGAPSVWRKGSSHLNGAAYLFYGPMTGSVDISMARCAMRGTVLSGASGWSVAMIGDQYGDGAPEILIGEPLTSGGGGVWNGGMLSVVSSEHL